MTRLLVQEMLTNVLPMRYRAHLSGKLLNSRWMHRECTLWLFHPTRATISRDIIRWFGHQGPEAVGKRISLFILTTGNLEMMGFGRLYYRCGPRDVMCS